LADFILHIPADALVALTCCPVEQPLAVCHRTALVHHPLARKVLATLVLAAGLGYLGWQESGWGVRLGG